MILLRIGDSFQLIDVRTNRCWKRGSELVGTSRCDSHIRLRKVVGEEENLVVNFLDHKEEEAQSIESAILAGISCFLPEVFVSFIKRMQVFSAVKLCDDASLFYGIGLRTKGI